MGADFCYALVDTSIKKQDLVEYVKTMSDEDVSKFADYHFGMFANDYETDEEFVTTTRANIIAFVEEAYGSENSREVGFFTVKGTTFLITGGMTWGDDPTDAYKAFTVTQELQLQYLSK